MRTFEVAQSAERAALAASGRHVQPQRFAYATPDGRPLPSDAKLLPEGAYMYSGALREPAASLRLR
ncbi:MAG: hypothetical protein NVS1B1_00750 [Candidatus Limnocylindrales bacterium]